MAIDMHAHWVPAELAEALRARHRPPLFRRLPDGRDLLCFAGDEIPLRVTALAERIAVMDRHGIDIALLSPGGLMLNALQSLPAATAAPLCRIVNDAAARACGAWPGRFRALAVLPNENMDAAIAEFARTMALRGFVGAVLPGNGFLGLKRAQRWCPLFAAAQAMGGAHMLVHDALLFEEFATRPKEGPEDERICRETLAMQAHLSAVMITLNLTGFLDPYPKVSVQVQNLGGNVPFEITRMDRLHLLLKRAGALPSYRFHRTVVDCNSFGAPAIELAVPLYSAQRIVLGTDGSEFGANWSLAAVHQAHIGKVAKEAILHGTAAAILHRYPAGSAMA